jgi:signal transduction histidine kinase/CheY-like chemotaxis protein
MTPTTDAQRLQAFVALMLRLAGQFINLPLARIDAAIDRALADTAEFVGADRAYLFHYDFDAGIGRNTHECCARGIEPQRDALQALPLDSVPGWLLAHQRGEAVHVPDVRLLPPGNLRDILAPQGILTTIALPLLGEQGCSGFVGFDFVREVRVIGGEEVALLQLFAQMLVNVGERGQSEAALAELNASLEARVAERTQQLAAAKACAEAADQAKSRLMARVSHELRTPLNAVLGFAQMLEVDEVLRSAPAAAAQVAQIRLAGAHLLRMVDDVLDLASAEAGRLRMRSEAVDLAALVPELLALAEPLARQHGVQLHGGLKADVPGWVQADRTRLSQVLMNLVSNGIKYNRPGGRVEVTAVPSPQGVRLTVEDTGVGLSPSQLAGLFEPFNRLGAEHGAVQGSGLGLTISHQLVALMGDALHVDSTQGQGSSFSFNLPACAAPSLASSDEADVQVNRPWANESFRVLYVEDNPVNVMLMTAMLEQPACGRVQLQSAADGPAGLQAAMQWQPDLILLDLSMPGMSGEELLHRLKADSQLLGKPCVAVSANALPTQIEAALRAGFDDYMTKPFTLQRLAELIGRYRNAGRAPQTS